MVKKKVVISVDEKFFKEVFEPKRKDLQKQIGVNNLSQSDFTKMIKELNLKVDLNKNKKRRKNVFYNF